MVLKSNNRIIPGGRNKAFKGNRKSTARTKYAASLTEKFRLIVESEI
jgi:hypothetical protein